MDKLASGNRGFFRAVNKCARIAQIVVDLIVHRVHSLSTPDHLGMETQMLLQTNINEAAPSPRAMWRSFAESVRADAVTEQTAEYLASGLSFSDFLHDECFVCPILGHHFLFADGVEIDGCWIHADADLIGHDDAAFNYGAA